MFVGPAVDGGKEWAVRRIKVHMLGWVRFLRRDVPGNTSKNDAWLYKNFSSVKILIFREARVWPRVYLSY